MTGRVTILRLCAKPSIWFEKPGNTVMLSFEDAEIIDTARELAALTGETLVDAIRNAVEEKLRRERSLRATDHLLAERLEKLELV
jgi:hypothetical protein